MMALRMLGLAAPILITVACGRHAVPPASTVAPAEAVAPAQLVPPAVDLSGSWFVGSGPEPLDSVITLRPSCPHNPAAWIIEQTGNAVEAWSFPATISQGIMRREPGLTRASSARGTISGIDLTLDEGGSRIVMQYDRSSTHLRGTRAGKPFWAVRQRVVREMCPGIP